MERNLKRHAGILVTVMLGAFAVLSTVLAWKESTTFDEQAHVGAAYSYVRYGDMNLNPEHPPLLKDLAGLPLLLMRPGFPEDSAEWREGVNEQWAVGKRFIHMNDAETVMFLSRLPMILVAVLLGLLVYRFTKDLAGTAAGLFALLLYVADPNIIGHGHYVTTDIGIAAVVLLSFYALIPFLRKPDAKRTILLGVALGIAQLVKFSSVLLFPYIAVVAVAYAITKPKPDTVPESRLGFATKQILSYGLRLVAATAVCFSLVWIVYAANIVNEPAEKMVATAEAFFPQDNDAARFAIGTVSALSDSAVTRPFAQYLLGFFKVFSRVAGGNTHFFLGNVSADADPIYFPFVFFAKETVPFLFLFLSVSVYTVFRSVKTFSKKPARDWTGIISRSIRGHVAQYALGGFAFFYAYISITGNLNIGFRHIFPVIPILHILVAKTVFDFARRRGYHGERTVHTAVVAFAVWIATIPALAYPSYLSYFNETVGGPKEGYRYVTDSNYDWGQDMKRLRDFVDDFNACKDGGATEKTCKPYADIIDLPRIDTLHMAYFGGADPEYYLGDKYVEWYADWGRRSGWHAMSATFWQENLYRENPEGKETYRWIIDGGYPMVRRAGDSIFIYYVPPFPESN